MDKIKEKDFAKTYNTLLICLLIASMIINLITMFVPIFHIDMGLIRGSESGIKFIGFNTEDDEDDWIQLDNYKYRTSPMEDFLDVESDFFDMIDEDTFGWKQIIRVILYVLIFFLIVDCGIIPGCLRFRDKKVQIRNNLSNISHNFWINTIYTVYSIMLCWILFNEWEFEGVMTFTFIPWIFQFVVYISSRYISNHSNRAMKGEVAPLKIGAVSFIAANNVETPKKNTEDDKVELLIKYKELLDNGVITEEEYNEKKQELL